MNHEQLPIDAPGSLANAPHGLHPLERSRAESTGPVLHVSIAQVPGANPVARVAEAVDAGASTVAGPHVHRPWAPLLIPLYRSFWIAGLFSNLGTWMHETGAQWLMNELHGSPAMVSGVRTAMALPVFCLALPAGVWADRFDRRTWLLASQSVLLFFASLMALLDWSFAGRMPVMSMGFLIEKDQAVIWRGPMLHGAINQFLRDTYWGDLDYLIIDMPPGTGDIALTLSQMLPLSGAVVICTPQEVALLDAVKAIAMFNKTQIPLLGMVENMSGFICPDCGKRYDIFGRGGARDKAAELRIPFLGDVPLNMSLRQHSDEGGLATALEDPTCHAAMDRIARALVRELARRAAEAPLSAPLPILT